MSKKGLGQKGTFSDLGLAVSRRYVVPLSRRRMLLLGGGLGGVLVLVMLADFVYRDAVLVSNGPLSSNHANLEGDCTHCHQGFAAVTREKCSHCHEKHGDELGVYTFDAHYLYRSNDFQRLVRHENESPCFSCHTEHEGRQAEITQVPDTRCLECHDVGSFNRRHPEFDFAAGGAEARLEAASLEFPHIHHVREVMKREALADVEQSCLYCHNPQPDGRNFKPLDFDRHCDACHLTTATQTPALPIRQENDGVGVETLESLQARRAPGTLWAYYTNPAEFRVRRGTVRKTPVYHRDPWITENLRGLRRRLYEDPGLADLLTASPEVAPHDLKLLYEEALETLEQRALELRSSPDREVQRQLTAIQALLARARQELKDPYAALDETEFLLALEPRAELDEAERQALETVVEELTEVCRKCHLVSQATIARVAKDQRTLRRAEFDHRAHILERGCLDCHTAIPFRDFVGNADPVEASVDRAAIQNLPTIETCRECHNQELASNRCVTCHLFHPNKTRRSELLLYLD